MLRRRPVRLSKEAKRLEGDVASAQRALRENPYTVESLLTEAEATRRLLTERARKARILVKQQQKEKQAKQETLAAGAAAAVAATSVEEASPAAVASGSAEKEGQTEDANRHDDNDDNDDIGTAEKTDETIVAHEEQADEEGLEVGEGLEVEGGFDPTPELKSRFADKSSSLRFVTADEDARMRKQDLARVFATRNKVVAAVEDEEDKKPSITLTAVKEASEEDSVSSSEEAKRDNPADDGAADDAGEEQRITKVQMKAFGAILEKTLSQSMFGRVSPSGSAGDGEASEGKMKILMSTTHHQQQLDRDAAAILTPPCKPKSKFFRSIRSPSAASRVDNDGTSNITGTGQPLAVPPPPPMMGLLSQIRGRGGGVTGSGSSSGDRVHAGMGELLAQIRAAKGNGGIGSRVDSDQGADSVLGEGKDSGIVPPPLPKPPAHPLPHRSLFAAAGPITATAAPQGPPPDFLAQVRAKAAEKQSLRCAAETESDN